MYEQLARGELVEPVGTAGRLVGPLDYGLIAGSNAARWPEGQLFANRV